MKLFRGQFEQYSYSMRMIRLVTLGETVSRYVPRQQGLVAVCRTFVGSSSSANEPSGRLKILLDVEVQPKRRLKFILAHRAAGKPKLCRTFPASLRLPDRLSRSGTRTLHSTSVAGCAVLSARSGARCVSVRRALHHRGQSECAVAIWGVSWLPRPEELEAFWLPDLTMHAETFVLEAGLPHGAALQAFPCRAISILQASGFAGIIGAYATG